MGDLDDELDSYWLTGSKGDDSKASTKGQEILDNQMESYWAVKPAETEATEASAAVAE